MARRTLTKPIKPRLRHVPFRLTVRLILICVTIFSMVLVGWMLWQVFFTQADPETVITNDRVELLQAELVQGVETYEQNSGQDGIPSSIFPTGDNTPVSGQ